MDENKKSSYLFHSNNRHATAYEEIRHGQWSQVGVLGPPQTWSQRKHSQHRAVSDQRYQGNRYHGDSARPRDPVAVRVTLTFRCYVEGRRRHGGREEIQFEENVLKCWVTECYYFIEALLYPRLFKMKLKLKLKWNYFYLINNSI